MTTLSLFPARIRFTNADGTLTPEAYRALQVLFQRVGGALGDNGTDVFAVFGGSDMDATMGEVSARETLMQPATSDDCCQFPDLSQSAGLDMLFPDVVQPAGGNTTDKVVVKAGTAALPSITTEGDENTGVYFPAADEVGITTGGTVRVRVTSTGTTLAGNTTIQGVTASGATGSGSLVFSNSPTLVTPNLGTPSALVGTNITGTAASLTAGAALSAPTGFHVHEVTVGGTTYTTSGPL
jgi:hypothetical protein